MQKLENKIVKKIYGFETKKTLIPFLIKAGAIVFFGLTGFAMVLLVIQELVQEQTFDLLQLFQEDFSVIRENIGNVLSVFFQEVSWDRLILAVIILSITVYLIIKLFRNLRTVKNKLRSIIKFWFSGRKW